MRQQLQHRVRKPPAQFRHIARLHEVNTTQLGKEVGVSTVHVCYVLTGRRQPSFSVAYRMAKALGMTLDAFYDVIETAKAAA
jgi:transcriptional regulator with XRE-family HTH domain